MVTIATIAWTGVRFLAEDFAGLLSGIPLVCGAGVVTLLAFADRIRPTTALASGGTLVLLHANVFLVLEPNAAGAIGLLLGLAAAAALFGQFGIWGIAMGGLTLLNWGAVSWLVPIRLEDQLAFGPSIAFGCLLCGILPLSHAKLVNWTMEIGQISKERDALASERANLEAKRDEAVAALEAKDRFVANVSHEIRTPLNGILGLLDLLEASGMTPQQTERIAHVRASGESLLAIVNDLLDLSKARAGEVQLETIKMDLGAVIEGVAQSHAGSAASKELELIVDVDPGLPLVNGDPHRVRQVVNNFVSNALKFTARGSVVAAARILERARNKVRVEISVTDTGIGLSEEQQERIFAPFAQADESTTREYGGTGLGLAICQRFVELMGSQIRVESRPGQGSKFYFELELSVAGREETGRIVPWMAPLRTLVVDASPHARKVLLDRLHGWSANAEGVADVDTAKQMLTAAALEGQPYRAVLLGLRTAGDRWRLRARELSSGVCGRPWVVVMAAAEVLNAGDEAGVPGVVAVLQKPVERKALMRAMRLVAETPRDKPLEPSRRIRQRAQSAASIPQSGLKILIGEDNPTNVMVMEGLLARLGYDVVVCNDGDAAVKAFEESEEREFVAVLMDGQMPVCDGYDATRRMRAVEGKRGWVRTPILAVTANAMPADVARAVQSGMDGHLAKPVRLSLLEELLDKWVTPRVLEEKTLESLRPLIEGNDQMLSRLIKSFQKTLDQRVDAMSNGDAESVVQAAHALKGAAAQIGLRWLAQECGRVEENPSRANTSLLEALARDGIRRVQERLGPS